MLKEIDNISASEELIQGTLEFCKSHSNVLDASNSFAAEDEAEFEENTAYEASAGGMTREYGRNSKAAKLTRKVNRWAVAAVACGVVVILSSGAALAYNAVTGDNIVSKIYKK